VSLPAQGRRPEWLRIRLRTNESFAEVRRMMDGLELTTVCEEARCPNIFECWSYRTATFMILGEVCTRQCGFCAVTSGLPSRPADPDEPRRVAEAVSRLGLAHAVITSVDRDDLRDGGAGHFARVIEEVRKQNPACSVEVLTPDFKGAPEALAIVLASGPQVFSHNMETVARLYRKARPGSRYEHSLGLLRAAAQARDSATAGAERDLGSVSDRSNGAAPGQSHGAAHIRSIGEVSDRSGAPAPARSIGASPEHMHGAAQLGEAAEGASQVHLFRVKTGLMVGLGETDEELRETFRDIRAAGVEVLTVGQYLQPSKDHLPVDRFVTPDQFAELKAYALTLGFTHVEAGPLVRSSYRAHTHTPSPRPLHVD
jgi:lipoic acid synthetase